MKRTAPADGDEASAPKRVARAAPEAPCGLVADVWRNGIIHAFCRTGYVCRTIVMLRRTCRWFALNFRVRDQPPAGPCACAAGSHAWADAFLGECYAAARDGHVAMLGWTLHVPLGACPYLHARYQAFLVDAVRTTRSDDVYWRSERAWSLRQYVTAPVMASQVRPVALCSLELLLPAIADADCVALFRHPAMVPEWTKPRNRVAVVVDWLTLFMGRSAPRCFQFVCERAATWSECRGTHVVRHVLPLVRAALERPPCYARAMLAHLFAQLNPRSPFVQLAQADLDALAKHAAAA